VNINTIVEAGTQAFRQRFMEICKKSDFSELNIETAEAMTTSMKQALSSAGATAFKTFVESFETNEETIMKSDGLYRFKLESSCKFLTAFGEVDISRRVYQKDRGGDSIVPLDLLWGMADEYATLDVRESVSYSVAHNTPEETEKLLQKCALFHPSATTIKRIANKTGSFFNVNDEEIRQRVMSSEVTPKESYAMVCSLDGTNVLLNEKGVRQGRPLERPKSNSDDKETTAYRNAMVGSLSFYAKRKEDEKHPERLLSRYVARMPEENALTFKKEFEFEVRHVLEQKTSEKLVKVLLMDGQRSLWKYTANNSLYSDFECLIDFYHTSEHLSKAAEALFGKGSLKATEWYEKHRKNLLEKADAPIAILRSMIYYQNMLKLSKSSKTGLKAEQTFFAKNKSKMLYANFISRGLPIGSGPIEAACKSIVKTRLGRSGMRWSRKGGQNILVLRAYAKSDRWESCWNAFKQMKMAA
jgi:hypothetical protein